MDQRVEAGRDLGPQALADLGRALPELINQGVDVLTMDASKVTEFDSQTLEALLEFDALVRSRGLGFRLCDPSELFALALAVTGLEQRLEVLREEPSIQPEGQSQVGREVPLR